MVAQSSINNKGEFGMLKKFFKAALTACIAVGMSTVAMAYVPVGDTGLLLQLDTSSTFGQRNDGGDDTAPWLQAESETNVSFLGMKGPWTAWADMEFDDSQTKPSGTQRPTWDIAQSYVKYNVNKQLALKIGTVHFLAGLPYGYGAGAFTSTYQYEGWDYAAYSESPGFEVSYAIGPGMSVSAALYGTTAAAMTGENEGSSTAVQFFGKAGDNISFQVGYLSETYDDFQSSQDDTNSNTFTTGGVKVGLGADMSIAFDFASDTLSYNVTDYKLGVTMYDLQFKMGGLGPGGIIATYAMTSLSDPDEAMVVTWNYGTLLGVKQLDISDLGLVYEIPIAPGRVQIQYMSKGLTQTDSGGTKGDTVTQTFLGVGFDFKI
jgi:hypothetical protein